MIVLDVAIRTLRHIWIGQFCARVLRTDSKQLNTLRAVTTIIWDISILHLAGREILLPSISQEGSRATVQRRGVDAGERESPWRVERQVSAAREGCGGASPAAAGPGPVSGQTSRFRGPGVNSLTRTPEANHVKRGTIPLLEATDPTPAGDAGYALSFLYR